MRSFVQKAVVDSIDMVQTACTGSCILYDRQPSRVPDIYRCTVFRSLHPAFHGKCIHFNHVPITHESNYGLSNSVRKEACSGARVGPGKHR